MKYLPLLLVLVLSGSAVADLTFSATAVSRGKKVDWKASGLDFVPIPQRSRFHHHRGDNDTTTPDEGGHHNHKRLSASLSSNWCGISQKAPKSGDPITNVYGVFSAPDLTARPGYSYPQFGSAWIGIDGGSCQTALLQAGITTVLNSNGGQSASAWFEWVPLASYGISGFPVKAGDWIVVNITATDPNNALIIISNENQSYTLSITLNNGPTLCRTDADWIMEDAYDSKGKQLNFARFQDLWFEDASAKTANGQHIGLNGASMIYLGSSMKNASCLAYPYDDSNFFVQSQG